MTDSGYQVSGLAVLLVAASRCWISGLIVLLMADSGSWVSVFDGPNETGFWFDSLTCGCL